MSGWCNASEGIVCRKLHWWEGVGGARVKGPFSLICVVRNGPLQAFQECGVRTSVLSAGFTR